MPHMHHALLYVKKKLGIPMSFPSPMPKGNYFLFCQRAVAIIKSTDAPVLKEMGSCNESSAEAAMEAVSID